MTKSLWSFLMPIDTWQHTKCSRNLPCTVDLTVYSRTLNERLVHLQYFCEQCIEPVQYWKVWQHTNTKNTWRKLSASRGKWKQFHKIRAKHLIQITFSVSVSSLDQISAKIYEETLVVCNIPRILTKFVLESLGVWSGPDFHLEQNSFGLNRKIRFWSFYLSTR